MANCKKDPLWIDRASDTLGAYTVTCQMKDRAESLPKEAVKAC